jgi:outer membrane protein assembly factor BamD (BamD/ComL family)
MSQAFSIVVETILSILGVAFIVWVFWRAIKRSDDPVRLIVKTIVSVLLVGGTVLFIRKMTGHLGNGMVGDYGSAFLIAGSVACCGIVLSIIWTPQIGALVSSPLTDIFDGGSEEPEPHPFYSIALAKRKTGKFTEAIAEIRKQLDKFPTDFEGQMLVAEIQAEDQKDLPGADITIQRICNQQGHPPRSVAYALMSLADWHLKYAQDNEAARAALEKIIEKFPETEFALQASQRIAHLADREHLLAPHDRRNIEVVEGMRDMGLLAAGLHSKAPEIPPEQQAVDYVKHLQQYPLDMEVREKLAMIYANHYQRLDLASNQLEQMIQTPNQPLKLVARWLNLLTDFQIRLGGNYDTARDALERIIKNFPNAAVAEVARRRIDLLKLELKGKDKSQDVKLGSYEDDVGLKYGSPH